MCSIEADIEDINVTKCSKDVDAKVQTKLSVCKKCGDQPIIILQKKDPFCRSCFLVYCHHKFRATIGKTKKIKPMHKVLLAYSGGLSSASMLHMVSQALADASHKKLLFVPAIFHIDESTISLESTKLSKGVKELDSVLKCSPYPILFSSLEMVFRDNTSLPFYWYSYEMPKNAHLQLKLIESLKCIKSLTSKQDYLECLRLQLITDVAEHAGYNFVFVGDSATNLSIKVLSDISMGKGSQVPSNTAFYDGRYKVPICRPLREFLSYELEMYNSLNNISYFNQSVLSTIASNFEPSIQRLTEKFVLGLQENFPATIYTIFRIGGKLSALLSEKIKETCFLCMSKKDNVNLDLCSALEALQLSSELSKPVNKKIEEKTVLASYNNEKCISDSNCETLVDIIFKNLCHGCQITVNEMGASKDLLLPLLEKRKKITREKMKEEISEFLLVDDKESDKNLLTSL